jgi:hypothetical protein
MDKSKNMEKSIVSLFCHENLKRVVQQSTSSLSGRHICHVPSEYAKYNVKTLYGVESLFIWSVTFCLLPVVSQVNGWYYCLSNSSLVPTSISLGLQVELESPLRQKCYPCCRGHSQLTGPLQDFTCILLGGVELELVLSCQLPPRLFHQLSLVASDSLSSISFSSFLSKGCLLKLVRENVMVLIISEKRQKPWIARQSFKQNELVTCALSQQTSWGITSEGYHISCVRAASDHNAHRPTLTVQCTVVIKSL